MINDRMRIGIVYDDSPDRPGGVTEYVTTLAAELAHQGHHAVLLTGESKTASVNKIPVISLAKNVRVRFNGNSLTIPIRTWHGQIAGVLDKECFDILHVQMPYSPVMAGRVIARASPQTAIIGTFHLAADRIATRVGARILAGATRRSLGRFDQVVAVSEPAAQAARELFDIEINTVIPNMTSVEATCKSHPQRYGPKDRQIIVFLGRLVPRKGVGCLIKAVAVLQSEGVAANLVIAGDGPLRERLERQSERLGLKSTVTFLGQIEAQERAPLLAAADLACFPSLHGESFGIVLVEAMKACAGAVIGSRIPGYVDVLANDERVLVEPGNVAGLAQRLAFLLRSDRVRQLIGREQCRIADRFDAHRVTSQIVALYAEASRTKKGLDRPAGKKAA